MPSKKNLLFWGRFKTMAVVDIREIWEGREGSWDVSAERTYTRTFLVRTDDPEDDALTVLADGGLPAIGTPYLTNRTSDLGALVKDKRPVQDAADPLLWRVTVNYASNFPALAEGAVGGPGAGSGTTGAPGGVDGAGGGGGTGGSGSFGSQSTVNPNPLFRQPLWRFSFQKRQVASTKDVAGQPFVNSARQPYEAQTLDISTTVIKVSKNYPSFKYSAVQGLINTINEDVWYGFQPLTCLCDGIEISSSTENGLSFWTLDYTILAKVGEQKTGLAAPNDIIRDYWEPYKLLDRGDYELLDGKRHIIRDATGAPLGQVLLDGHGVALPEGGDPVWNSFYLYRSTKWKKIIP